MDKNLQILLHNQQNIASVNVDEFTKIQLVNNLNEINEYDIRNSVSASEVFNVEREANAVYRIYGRIEYMSLLNGLKNNYSVFKDFFLPQKSNCKNIYNSFKFYLVRPATGYTHSPAGGNNLLWARYFQVVATPNEFELYPAGYSNNVYGEQTYAFNFNVDVNISGYHDYFGFPLTELFLYVEYQKSITETIRFIKGDWTSAEFQTTTLNIGDYVKTNTGIKIGDFIEYSKSEFLQVEHTPQTFQITTPYNSGRLIWKYNPFIPFRLRYFTDSLYLANTGSTSYELVSSIPYYATKIDNNGNYVWRDIMPQGYIDPLTGIGVDYPFVNKKRYLFSSNVLDITPDLNDPETNLAFAEVWFDKDAKKVAITPAGDINNIGKPCL